MSAPGPERRRQRRFLATRELPSVECTSGGISQRGAVSLYGRRCAGLPVAGGRGRVEADRLVEVLDGLLVHPQFGLGVAAAEVGCRAVGVQADHPVVVGDGFLVAVQSGARPGPLGIQPPTVRVEADRLGAIGDGFLEPVQIGVIKAEAGPAL